MKNIITRTEKNTLGTATHDWAIFDLGCFQFYGFDYNEKAVIFVNCIGKFIIGKKFKNCITIGSGYVLEYDTFAEAAKKCDKM